jgi:hypothetical protein
LSDARRNSSTRPLDATLAFAEHDKTIGNAYQGAEHDHLGQHCGVDGYVARSTLRLDQEDIPGQAEGRKVNKYDDTMMVDSGRRRLLGSKVA